MTPHAKTQLSTNLSPAQNGQLVSRIFTDCTGKQFRLTFWVSVVDGEVRGSLVSAHPVTYSYARISGEVMEGTFCLPVSIPKVEASTPYIPAYAPFVSPYFSLDFLITSQPTRAPSHR
jgi:hypothetical protein